MQIVIQAGNAGVKMAHGPFGKASGATATLAQRIF
ncbi:protein of unknown function [Burkholderia multivorans]